MHLHFTIVIFMPILLTDKVSAAHGDVYSLYERKMADEINDAIVDHMVDNYGPSCNRGKTACCTPDAPCTLGEGGCSSDSACISHLICGKSNCHDLLQDGSGVRSPNYVGTRRKNCCTLPESLVPHIGDQVDYVLDEISNNY